MEKKVYVCKGTCGAKVSQEEFEDGLTRCGEKSCTMYDQPFEERDEEELERSEDTN